MGKVLRSLIIRTGVDLGGAQRGFNKLAGELRTSGRNMTKLGGTLTKSITMPVLGATAAAIKFGMDFETSVAKVGTIADTGAKSIGVLKGEVLELSDATGIAGTEINETLYQAISATNDTKNAMELVDVAVRSAKGGFTESAIAVDGLTAVLNSYNIELTRSEEIANLFFVAQKKGKTTFGELAQNIGTVAPLAYNAGVSIKELLADVTVLTAQGIDTASAITYLRSAISSIISPTKEARDMANELGIDFSISAIKAKGFTGFLGDLQDRVGGNSEKLATLFGNIRGLNAILSLTSEGGMTLLDETLKEMATNTTAVNDAFETMTDTTGNQLNISLNKLKNTGIETFDKLKPLITDKIIPAISDFAEKTGDVVEGFSEMSSGAQKFTMLGLGTITMLGPSLLGMGKLATGFSKVAKNAAAATKAIKGGKGITEAVSAFLGPAGTMSVSLLGATAVIGGLVIAFQELTKEEREYAKQGEKLYTTVQATITSFKEHRDEISKNKQIASELMQELFELNQKERLSEIEKARLNDIVKQLNNSYDGLNLSIDGTTGLLKGEKKAVEDLVKAKQDEIEKQAYQDEMLELRKEEIDLTNRLAETTKKLAEYLEVPEDKITSTFLKIRTSQAKFKDQMQGMQFVMEDWIENNDKLLDVTRLLSAATQDYSDTLDTVAAKTKTDLLKSAKFTTEQMTDLANAFVVASFDIEGATKMTEGEFTDMVKSMSHGLMLSQDTIDELFALYGTSFDQAKEDYETYYSELETRTEAHYNKMGGLLSDFERDDVISVETLTTNAKAKGAALTEFGDGIETLANRVDENGEKLVPDDLLAELNDLPLESVDTIKELATASDTELGAFVDTWQANSEEAHNQALAEMEKFKPEIVSILEETSGEIVGFSGDYFNSGKEIGKSIIDGVASGLGNKALMVANARAAAKAALTTMQIELDSHSPSKKGIKLGESLPEGAAIGVKNKTGMVISTVKQLGQGMINGLKMKMYSPDLSLNTGMQGLNYAMAGGAPGAGYQGKTVHEVHYHQHFHSAIFDKNALDTANRELKKAETRDKLRTGRNEI